ncbi:UNVERIFIED_CONTAM: arginine deiminase family protein [Halobacillus marinus]|uniref:dimethylarginine dimethylaminohydrolase family protein n=1 Tax=Bacillus sp. SB49 TaxID=1071080 RepID=UPI0003FFBC0D|nr:arginine deiminase family protein [Bacillus sp. SB49]QHT45334.1 hypothetical protein M662_01885 [Bacillus sp. SB49]
MEGVTESEKVGCRTEYATLKKVLVCKPAYMKIGEVINETQKHYGDVGIDTSIALKQHEAFVRVLQEFGVEVLEIPAEHRLNEQVFTRDIAFTIHDRLFIASMKQAVRRGETEALSKWLTQEGIPAERPLSSSIEGGDVIIDEDTIWVGISGRTSEEGASELAARLPDYRMEPLCLQEDILHLDCVFNIISPETAIIYPPAFTKEGLEKIKSRFRLIPVTKKEQFYMGPNVLSIGEGRVISLPQNDRLNGVLQSEGFEVVPVDFSEIIKSGGSFRCCSMPLQRQ